jgi:altronate hydrolase
MNPDVSAIRLDVNDNVAVARHEIHPGELVVLDGLTIQAAERIPFGHKMALRQVAQGDSVIKYGQPIGIAIRAVTAGQWVHTHNVANRDSRKDHYEFATHVIEPPKVAPRTFQGYRRPGGKAGTRNYVAVISNVNCSASVSRYVARHFTAERLAEYPNVDGVVAFVHHGGCAMQFGGQQHRILNRVMGGIARHPNIGAYLMIGLGCEQATLDYLVDDQRLVQIDGRGDGKNKPITLTMQSTGGTKKTIQRGIELVESILPRANDVQREPIPMSELILGTNCGGSDGNSGITANPALGRASDLVVAQGGTSVLAETTEIVGAEHLLTQRAVSEEVGRKLLERIEWWRWYANLFGEVIDDNRSAGNAAGGLTTITEKSLGAIAKAGSTPLRDVYHYAEPITSRGLVVMDTPGFDPCSVTGLVAGGANIVVFTTGRGSCYGCKPTPSIKVATNTPMYRRMEDDMDIDAGTILSTSSVEEVGAQIFEKIASVASGEKTKSELHGIGDEEFVPWTIGPVL